MTIAFWVLAGLTALRYLAAGIMKLVRPQPVLLAVGMGWTENVSQSGIKLTALTPAVTALALFVIA